MATRERIKKGFSKLLKEEKLKLIANYFENPGEVISLLKSYWHSDSKQQQLFDEFSENTITNFFIPYGISPNVTINGKDYIVPMVIEESSVVAAASSAAKFWANAADSMPKSSMCVRSDKYISVGAATRKNYLRCFPKSKNACCTTPML